MPALPTSEQLRWSYPTTGRPCAEGYVNQCAIRMSVALEGAGIDLSDYHENKCKHGHARGAEGLARYLKKKWGQPTWAYRRNKARAHGLLQKHNGVVFFKNCFTREGETERVGDHIDVWYHGAAMTYENFEGSEEVWFWKLSP